MEKLNAHKKIEKARVGLYLDAPFWTTTLFKLPMIEDKEGTITPKYATDGKAIYFNPKFADTLTLEETKGILAHETGHVILLHPFRRGTRELRKWNFACDYSLNQILIDAGFKLPKDGLIDPQYKGMDAEKIYTLIPDPPEGEPQPAGEVLDHPAKSEPEKKQAELEQRLYNVQAGQIAKKQGNLPNGMERLIDDLTAPKINIKEVIGRFVEQTSKNDYTWTAPNRRYLGHELYLPSLKSPELGHIAFLVDISGSVSDEQAKDLLAVIKGTIEVYRNAELSLIYFATSASQPLTITDETEIQNIKTPQVGSGTNYRPPFEMLKTANLDPIGIIVLTDGYCHSFPDREPDAPVLWILTGRNESFKPPFGEVYLLEMED
jgi:predicted metal-dependent peptidase